MKKYLLLYTAITFFICTLQEAAEGALHDFNGVNLKDWKKVALVYFHDYPYRRESLQDSPDCFFVPDLSLASGPATKSVWRCEERISLLRPAVFINRWKREQDINGAVDFSLPGSGIHHVAAYIESVSSIEHNTLPVSSDSEGSEVVTGVFLRHSMNVRTYTFESIATGQLSKINATPEHRFYVKNRHAWIPLYKIEAGMIMTDKHNQPVRLLCSNDQRGHCGVPLHPGEITTIYNLEVYKKHVYFAGRRSLLVHNMYYDDLHPEGKPGSLESIVIRKMARPLVIASYQTMVEELFEYKINAHVYGDDICFAFHQEISELIDKVVKGHNQRMRNYKLVPYEMTYSFENYYRFNPENVSDKMEHAFYGCFSFSFIYPHYFYESDYLTSIWVGNTGEPIGFVKKVSLGWGLMQSEGIKEKSDPLLWILCKYEPILDIIRDFEEYSKLVQPYFSASDARKFKNIIS